MDHPLRPMSTGELLDRTFSLYRKNFVLFLGIAAVTHAVYFAYGLLTVRNGPFGHAAYGPAFFGNLGAAWAFMTVVLTVSQAATVKAVAAVHLDQPTSVWKSYKSLQGRIISIFGVLIFVFLIAGLITGVLVIVALAIIGLVVAAVSPRSAPRSIAFNVALALIFFSVAFGIFVAVYVRYALAVQACVVESLRAWASMKRSAVLSKGGRWRIAAIYVVLVVFSWILGTSFTWIAQFAARPWHSPVASTILVDCAGFLSGSLTGPLATIGISLAYYDERVRKEAFDLQLMMANLDAPVAPVGTPVTV